MERISRSGVVAALFVLVVAGVCVRLGFWQLDRLEQRRERNAALEQAVERPPIMLRGATLSQIARAPEAFLNRRVTVRGVYDVGQDIVLRGRSREGQPGVHLVTPLRLRDSDTAVLVNRGWAASPDAATVDPTPFAEPGPQQLVGLLQALPAGVNAGTLAASAGRSEQANYARLDLPTLQARLPYPVAPFYIQHLDPSAPSDHGPDRVPLPQLDEGSHLSYAVQWFSFAAIALVGFAVVVLRRP